MTAPLSPSELADRYLDALVHDPYPVQEEAILEWFTSDEGIMLCAPTGMGKTLVAHATLFEALHQNKTAYYTTPLIALTEQKFHELGAAAERWGFSKDDVGLVTGNRKVNPDARVLVVVAEILLNRLLNPDAFDFADVGAVVMDEFHSFNDPERGIVWELTLSMLPAHVRLMLLSATVGNMTQFLGWLAQKHGRKLRLVHDEERRVPLTFEWIADRFLSDQIETMAAGVGDERRTPALVFCFNREECWTVAEQMKGLNLLADSTREQLRNELADLDWSKGAGPKLKQILWRGIGVHHAGVLPKYRRLIEDLYERKLLSVAVCTETLAAGINLPARSVVMTTLVKGPFGKKKLVGASTAHQIFGRAGRPQFDTEGFVYALAHEDDVRIAKWQEKFDQIPEGTKDPNLIKVKKNMRKKRPTRRDNQQYWSQTQFQKLIEAPASNLESRGNFPWRLLAYLLQKSPDVERLRSVVQKRLMDPQKIESAEKALDHMLLALHAGEFVKLEPPPPSQKTNKDEGAEHAEPDERQGSQMLKNAGIEVKRPQAEQKTTKEANTEARPPYRPLHASPTEKLNGVLVFRSIHPLYGLFLLDHLGIADPLERLHLFESLMELPRPIVRGAPIPSDDEVPLGPLLQWLNPELISRGLIAAETDDDDEDDDDWYGSDEEHTPTLPEKLRLLFDELYPTIHDVRTQSVSIAGELLRTDGDFDKFVRNRNLVKQEGIVFRHLLRLILLCGEFADVCPKETGIEEWQGFLRDTADRLTAICQKVDPQSTERAIEDAGRADVVEGESIRQRLENLPSGAEITERADDKHWDELNNELSG